MIDPRITSFLKDIFEVYSKHGLAVGHGDDHGGFQIEKDSEYLRTCLENAIPVNLPEN